MFVFVNSFINTCRKILAKTSDLNDDDNNNNHNSSNYAAKQVKKRFNCLFESCYI